MAEAALLFLLFLLGKSKKTTEVVKPSTAARSNTPAQLPAPGVNVFAQAWKTRTADLVKRATSGERWRARMAAVLGSDDAAYAACRWIGIESGGNPKTKTSLGEYGLAQGMKNNYSAADWKVVTDPRSTDEEQAKAAGNLIVRSTKAVTGSPVVASGRQGLGKLYHGLPLLVKELRTQGLMKASVLETLVAMLASYKPSAKVASYAKGDRAITGNAVQDLALRFVAPAAVVAYGEASIGLLDTIAKELRA